MCDLPKISFVSCDETSLTLDLGDYSWNPETESLHVQFKEPPVAWGDSQSLLVSDKTVVHGMDLAYLKPGTPYFVRLSLTRGAETIYGPEAVFDTMPVDCTPRNKKKCNIM